MIEQYKINKAANNYAVSTLGVPELSCEQGTFDESEVDFKAGVKWAEIQIEDIIIEFGNYLLKRVDGLDHKRSSIKHSLNKFLREND